MQLFTKEATSYPQYNFNYTINNYAEPGETANFISGSMATKVYVIQQTKNALTEAQNLPSTFSDFNFITRTKGLYNITYTATEKDRGNAAISEVFVIDNRVYTSQYNINVPYSNKVLQVTYASYRNKTEPGNKETWTVNIKGNKGEKIAAELLTTMYDASLDQFKKHNWFEPNIWESKYFRNEFFGNRGFNKTTSNQNLHKAN